MTELTEDQLALLSTLALLYPAGGIFDNPAIREMADGLVNSGRLTAIEDVEGGYRLSDEMASAHRECSALMAAQAEMN